jgi:hypothetical protein
MNSAQWLNEPEAVAYVWNDSVTLLRDLRLPCIYACPRDHELSPALYMHAR